jgi:hypothetical protein
MVVLNAKSQAVRSIGTLAGAAAVLATCAAGAAAQSPDPGARDSRVSAAASTASPACDAAQRSVTQATRRVARAKRGLRSARTRVAKGKARKEVGKAKRQLQGAKTRRAGACEGITTPQRPQTPQGPPTGPPPSQPPSDPPPQPNHQPDFSGQTVRSTYENQYTIVMGRPCLSSQRVTITLSPGASDADGDPLAYEWSASNGNISGSELTGTWQRVVQNCAPQSGTVTVTANDGKGGSDTFTINYR